MHASGSARDVATLAALVVTAISFHFLLALPDGRLHDGVRRTWRSAAMWWQWPSDWVRPRSPTLQPGRRRHQLGHGGGIGDRPDAEPLHRIHRLPPRADGVVRDRRDLAATVALVATVLHLLVGWPGQLGAVAAAATVLVPLGLLAGESRSDGPTRQPRPGPGARGVRLRRRGVGHLPGGGARAGSRAEDHRRQGGAGALHGGVGRRRPHLRAGAGPLPRLGDPVRLRVAGGARRGAADLRQQAHPRHPDGRAVAAARRVAAQDDGPDQRRGLHGHRRGARAHRVRSRSGPGIAGRVAAGAAGRDAGRGLGHGVGVRLAARCSSRARGRAAPGGAGQPRRGAAGPGRRRAVGHGQRLLRRRRPGAGGPGPAGRAGPPQLATRHRPADHPGRGAQAGRRPP